MKRAPVQLPEEVRQILAPFFPQLDLARIRIHAGIPFYVRGGPLGYADRNRIYLAPGAYRIDTIEGVALLAHELAHCEQYRRLGTWRFRAKYLWAYFDNRRRGLSPQEAYLNIPFEIEAREVEATVQLALQRLRAAFF